MTPYVTSAEVSTPWPHGRYEHHGKLDWRKFSKLPLAKIIDILGSTAKGMLSWLLRVRMFKLAYAAAEVFNLLGCVCDCGSFFSFHKERLELSKRGQSITCACLYAMTLCYSQYHQRQWTILSRRILIVAGHGRRVAECAVRMTPFFS